MSGTGEITVNITANTEGLEAGLEQAYRAISAFCERHGVNASECDKVAACLESIRWTSKESEESE